jgi:RNA polymerase sigma-70 factor (ECF subfamily)
VKGEDPMEQSDEEIMMDYQSGREPEAVSIIFFRYKSRILNFCLRILGNRADAEDVTGDVFLTLFSRKYVYDSKAKFSTWLYTVARNRCISRMRNRQNIVSVWFSSQGSNTHEQWEIEDSEDLAIEQLAKREAASCVKRAIRQLPYEQREALILREYHRLSYDEISQILNCSLEKVKILIFRGRECLRKELKSFIEEERR